MNNSVKEDVVPLIKNQARGLANQRAGLQAESLAVRQLRAMGYTIIARRLATPYGEIDIVACDAENLVFVEVKKRGNISYLAGAISKTQQNRLVRAACLFFVNNPEYSHLDPRIDVVMYFDNQKLAKKDEIIYLENAIEFSDIEYYADYEEY